MQQRSMRQSWSDRLHHRNNSEGKFRLLGRPRGSDDDEVAANRVLQAAARMPIHQMETTLCTLIQGPILIIILKYRPFYIR